MGTTKALPEGTVTFLFTDIEGSTRLLQHLGGQYAAVREEHRRLLRDAFQRGGGDELGTEGDSFFVVFPTATGAVAATVAAQRALAAHSWPAGAPVRVRMGLHTGTPTLTLGEYVGLDVHRAARISAAGHGGQVLLSQSTRSLVEHDLPEGTSLRNLGSHRLKDLQQPEQLFQVVLADLPGDFPPLRSLELVAHNLPIQLTSFIGREREMAEVAQLLTETPLLTLTGAGGCGKTRLALQVAAERVEEYADGVWLVDLSALGDAGLVPQAVAVVLGVREEPGRPLIETLADSLRPKRLLLVLDNCEHLVAACAWLVERLLRTCPGLCVLATSREVLGIVGEAAWRVPPLSLPDPERLPPAGAGLVSALTEYEAVRLFIERAQLSRPRFAVTHDNARTVAQVCVRLDGIPLAVELAAARVRVLAVDQIAARLDDRFRLLTGGSRTALPRQQTLRATIDWSYELLSESERALLRRLSVFAGGFTLAALEAVCAGDGVSEEEILDLLARLVDKSLVLTVEPGEAGSAGGASWGTDPGRFRLLETIRQYGAEHLEAAGEAAIWRGRHRDWFLTLAEQAEPELQGPRQAEWLERLEMEYANLRTALNWSVEGGEAEAGMRLGGALGRFWSLRAYRAEGRERLAALLALVGASEPRAARAKALQAAGVLAYDQGDHVASRALYEESLAIWRELGERRGIANLLNNLGNLAYRQGEFEASRSLHEESLAIRREMGEPWEIAASLNNLGILACDQGDYERARSLHEESLAIRRGLGDKWVLASSLMNLGIVTYQQGDYGAARTLYEESLAYMRELRDQRGVAYVLNNLGNVAVQQGDYEPGRALHQESLEIKRSLGDRWGVASSLDNLGSVAQYQGDCVAARALLEESLAMRRELGDRQGIANVLGNLGNVAREQGDVEAARSLHEQSLELCRELGDRRGLSLSLHALGGLALDRGEREAARALCGESLTIRHELGDKAGIAASLEGLACVAGTHDKPARAARLFGAASALRDAIGAPLTSPDRTEYERRVAAVRTALGDEAFAAAWAAGAAMTLEQATTCALEGAPGP
jgi:predicted ATPase/class 3 adenylate cyclase/Tfp pilus assembly protein PilF